MNTKHLADLTTAPAHAIIFQMGRSTQSGYVYFIQAELTQLIKIGFSSSQDTLVKRFKSLQGESPDHLKILGTFSCTFHTEKSIHQRFAKLCDHGEWFLPEQELLDFIKNPYQDYVFTPLPIPVKIKAKKVKLKNIKPTDDYVNRTLQYLEDFEIS